MEQGNEFSKNIKYFGSDALTLEAAENLVSKRGWYNVVIHGDKSGLAFTRGAGSFVTVRQLYEDMLAAGISRDKIRLMFCYAGKLNIGTAAQLSKLAGL
jgi:hypothetical protein